MLVRRSRTGKEPVTWSSDRKLASKRIHGNRRERDFRHTILRLGVRNPDGGIGDVQVVLPHGQKFLIDPQASLREDANDVAQKLGTVPLNALLFRPRYVVWLEQPFDHDRKLDAGTWIRRKKLLPNGHIEHTPKHPEFLVYGGWLHDASFVIAILRFGSDALTKTFAKEQFNIVSRYVDQPASSKSKIQMLGRS